MRFIHRYKLYSVFICSAVNRWAAKFSLLMKVSAGRTGNRNMKPNCMLLITESIHGFNKRQPQSTISQLPTPLKQLLFGIMGIKFFLF